MSESVQQHRAQAPQMIRCGVVTVSDTRTPDTDKSGQLIKQRLESAGHQIVHYQIVKDEPAQIDERISSI